MSRWTSVALTGLACCLTLPALSARTALGCPPPLTQDQVKKATEVELRGRLQSVLLRCGPGSKAWQVVADGKTYSLDFATPELAQQAATLDGQAVALTGTLNNNQIISVKTLTAADDLIIDLPQIQ